MRTFKNFKQLFQNEANNDVCNDDGEICYSFDGETVSGEVKEKEKLDNKKIKNGKSYCSYDSCIDEDEWGNATTDYRSGKRNKDRSINEKRREQRKKKQMFYESPSTDSFDEEEGFDEWDY